MEKYVKNWTFMPDAGMPDGLQLFDLPLKIESKHDESGKLIAKV